MNRKLTVFLPFFMILAILLTLGAGAAAFEDVPEDAYFAPAVQWALDNSITTGTSATTFSPSATCTRGQVVTFLWRSAGCPEPDTEVCPFTDVAPGSYYEKAVLWAVEYGITNGTSATEFSPDALCTSAHILTFLWRSLEEAQPVITDDEILSGVDPNAYYARPWTWAANNDMLQDMDDFDINAPCSRAITVTWLYRASQINNYVLSAPTGIRWEQDDSNMPYATGIKALWDAVPGADDYIVMFYLRWGEDEEWELAENLLPEEPEASYFFQDFFEVRLDVCAASDEGFSPLTSVILTQEELLSITGDLSFSESNPKASWDKFSQVMRTYPGSFSSNFVRIKCSMVTCSSRIAVSCRIGQLGGGENKYFSIV